MTHVSQTIARILLAIIIVVILTYQAHSIWFVVKNRKQSNDVKIAKKYYDRLFLGILLPTTITTIILFVYLLTYLTTVGH